MKGLSQAVGLSERTIRYPIAEDVVPQAMGTGRGADAYDVDHLAQARDRRRLMEAGLGVAAIRATRTVRAKSGVLLNDGVLELTLVSLDALAGFNPGDLKSLLADIQRVVMTALEASQPLDGEENDCAYR